MKEKILLLSMGVVFWIAMIFGILITVVFPKPGESGLIYYIPVIMQSAEGLKPGARVQILGVDKGYVHYLHYSQIDENGNLIPYRNQDSTEANGQVVIAVLNFKKPIQMFENYKIRTKYEAIISEKVVDIDPGDKASKVQYTYWNRADQLYFRKKGQVPPVGGTMLRAGNTDDPLTIIANVLHENRKDLRTIVSNIRQATDKVNTGRGTAALLINQDQIVGGTSETLSELSLLVRDGRKSVEALRETRAPVDFIGAYVFALFRLAAGQPL